MQNYSRSVRSHVWADRTFHRLTPEEKLIYLYLLTGPVTSDTSVFLCPLDQMSLDLGIPMDSIEKVLKRFIQLNIVAYDFENEEICMIPYFTYGTSPVGALYYEMLSKDHDKIKNKNLIKYAVESARNADISMAYFAAIQDIFPELSEDDFPIRPTKSTADDIRNAAKRGRKKINEKRKAEKQREDLMRKLDEVAKNEVEEEDPQEEEMPF